MQKIDSELDLELCAFLVGWHELEGDGALIDMNLSPMVAPKKYASQQEVLQDIENFLTMDEIKNHDLIRRKMTAHRYYLMRLMGEKIPSDEYLYNTMNIKPIIFPEEKIQALREQTSRLLAPFDLKIDYGMTKALCALDEQVKGEDVIKLFNDHHNLVYPKLSQHTGIQADFTIKYDAIDEQVTKMAEIRGDGKNYDVIFNMYHMNDFGAAKLKTLSTHEITGHAVQFAMLRQQSDAGLMPRYLSYMTVHEPLQFSAEGLAETLQYFYPGDFDQSPMMQAVLSIHRLRRVVRNNAATRLNRGEDFKECLQYIYDRAPDNTPEKESKLLEDVTTPLGASYHQVYCQGLETFLEIAGTHQDKDSFLKSVYTGFLMPDQIIKQAKRPILEFI